MDYERKYYNLLGWMPNFYCVIKNGGKDWSGRYYNQCMLLSILDYLNGVINNNFNSDEIRAIGTRNNTVINDVG